MHWQIVIALILAIPVILFPMVFIWYLNVSGIFIAIKEAKKRRDMRVNKKDTTED